jgi:hypothetical protein
MISLRTDLIEALRDMGRRGEAPSAMLRAVVARVGAETADRPVLVRYFSEAFGFADGQAYKIFGWFPDGSGALSDSDIDGLLSERIRETRAVWDNGGGDSSASRLAG